MAPPATTTSGEPAAPAARRRRGRMSAAQRKAVGERMKKYWAARRAAQRNGYQRVFSSHSPEAGAERTPNVKTRQGVSEAWRQEDVRRG